MTKEKKMQYSKTVQVCVSLAIYFWSETRPFTETLYWDNLQFQDTSASPALLTSSESISLKTKERQKTFASPK